MKKRLATEEEKRILKSFLIAHQCPPETADQIIRDRPMVAETRKGMVFFNPKKTKPKSKGFG